MDNQSDSECEDDLMEPEPPQKRTVPTVFQWENGGREVLLTGSFNDWKTRIPMSQRLLHVQLFISCTYIIIIFVNQLIYVGAHVLAIVGLLLPYFLVEPVYSLILFLKLISVECSDFSPVDAVVR